MVERIQAPVLGDCIWGICTHILWLVSFSLSLGSPCGLLLLKYASMADGEKPVSLLSETEETAL